MSGTNNSKTEWDNHDNDNPDRSADRPSNSERKFESSYDESRDRPSDDRRPRYPRDDRRSYSSRDERDDDYRRPASRDYPRDDRYSDRRYPREDRFSRDYSRDDRYGDRRYSREDRFSRDYSRDDRSSYKRRDPYDDDDRRPPSRFRSYDSDRYDSRRFEKRPRQMREDPSEPNVTIGLFNLSYNLTQRDFEEFLNTKLADFEGKFTSKLIISNETNRCRGYGFVTFESLEDSIKAKPILDDGEILGQKYRAAYSIQRRNFERRSSEPVNGEKPEVEECENN